MFSGIVYHVSYLTAERFGPEMFGFFLNKEKNKLNHVLSVLSNIASYWPHVHQDSVSNCGQAKYSNQINVANINEHKMWKIPSEKTCLLTMDHLDFDATLPYRGDGKPGMWLLIQMESHHKAMFPRMFPSSREMLDKYMIKYPRDLRITVNDASNYVNTVRKRSKI